MFISNLMSASWSHSSNASITITTDDGAIGVAATSDSGPWMSFSNCSFTDFPTMAGLASRAFLMKNATPGMLKASWWARVDISLFRLPLSISPLLMKKLAPRSPRLDRECARVRAMVDFPIPAMPFSQKVVFDLGSSIQRSISLSSSSRVLGKHVGLCSSALESKEAPCAIGS
uniref:Uncharacterized protein n=1 Tax=Fusarium oxysporum (strain Fo5176) TaxID=660025 RepID=A0A0D2YKN5_FUSOF